MSAPRVCEADTVRMLRVDADHDGAVTQAEALASVGKRVARMDANGDGTLTKDELVHGHGRHHHREGGPRS